MKKKSLFKRLSSVALAFLLSLSALTQGITASAFSDKTKPLSSGCQHGAMISVAQVCQMAMILKQGNTMTLTSLDTLHQKCRISQHLITTTLTALTLISCIIAEQFQSSRHLMIT